MSWDNSFTPVSTRTDLVDANAAADVNQLEANRQQVQANVEALKGGDAGVAPTKTLEETITELIQLQSASMSLKRSAIINGGMKVAQRAVANLSTSYVIGQVDRMAFKASGTLVSAGTLEQTSSANIGTSGYASKLAGVTITGTGIVYMNYRMIAKDAVNYKNGTISIKLPVYHDVGSAIDYTMYVNKADAEDDFSSVTAISDSGAQSIDSEDAAAFVIYENVSVGDCSNGLEIEVQAECGAITTKNFEFAEFQMNEGSVVLPFSPRYNGLDEYLCKLHFERKICDYIGHSGFCTSTTEIQAYVPYDFPKRKVPTSVTMSDPTEDRVLSTAGLKSPTGQTLTPKANGVVIIADGMTGLTAFTPITYVVGQNSGDWLDVDCELY